MSSDNLSSVEKTPVNELDFGDSNSDSSKSDDLSDSDSFDATSNLLIKSTKDAVKNHTKFKSSDYRKNKLSRRSIIEYIYVHPSNSYLSWKEVFPDKKITLRSLVVNNQWQQFLILLNQNLILQKWKKNLQLS